MLKVLDKFVRTMGKPLSNGLMRINRHSHCRALLPEQLSTTFTRCQPASSDFCTLYGVMGWPLPALVPPSPKKAGSADRLSSVKTPGSIAACRPIRRTNCERRSAFHLSHSIRLTANVRSQINDTVCNMKL